MNQEKIPDNNPTEDNSSQEEDVSNEHNFNAEEVYNREKAILEKAEEEQAFQEKQVELASRGKTEAQEYKKSRKPFAWMRKREEQRVEQELAKVEAEKATTEALLNEKLLQIDREIEQAKSERKKYLNKVIQLETRVTNLHQAIDSNDLPEHKQKELRTILEAVEPDLKIQKDLLETSTFSSEMTQETLGWERAVTEESFRYALQSLRKQSAQLLTKKQFLIIDKKMRFNPNDIDQAKLKELGASAMLAEDATHNFNYISKYEEMMRKRILAKSNEQTFTTQTERATETTPIKEQTIEELHRQFKEADEGRKKFEQSLDTSMDKELFNFEYNNKYNNSEWDQLHEVTKIAVIMKEKEKLLENKRIKLEQYDKKTAKLEKQFRKAQEKLNQKIEQENDKQDRELLMKAAKKYEELELAVKKAKSSLSDSTTNKEEIQEELELAKASLKLHKEKKSVDDIKVAEINKNIASFEKQLKTIKKDRTILEKNKAKADKTLTEATRLQEIIKNHEKIEGILKKLLELENDKKVKEEVLNKLKLGNEGETSKTIDKLDNEVINIDVKIDNLKSDIKDAKTVKDDALKAASDLIKLQK